MTQPTPPHTVGRTSFSLVDHDRNDRAFAVEIWFPQVEASGEPSLYELLPGVGFYGAARNGGQVLDGPLPWVILSHGHMGTRLVYSQLCEALAATGHVVFALDHPGDTLFDVVSGAGVDEDSNIALRVGDLTFLHQSITGEIDGLDHGLNLNHAELALVGHSFGAYSVMAWAGSQRGRQVTRSVTCLQPYLMRMTPLELASVTAPVFILAGANDVTTPVATNVLPALPHVTAPMTVIQLDGVGHQGCSDVGLYIETAPTIPDVPEFVVDFLNTMAADTTGTAGEPWRPVRDAHIELVSTWLAAPHAPEAVILGAKKHRGKTLSL
jgi:dienelactone hydrolase